MCVLHQYVQMYHLRMNTCNMCCISIGSLQVLENGHNLWPIHTDKKLKCTLVQALRLCTGRTAHRGSRGIALSFHDHGTRRGWGVSVTPRAIFTPGQDSVPIVQEAGWASGPVWTGAENLAPTGIRSPDRPARSQSLYRLSYPAHIIYRNQIKWRTSHFKQCYCWGLRPSRLLRRSSQ